MVFGVKVNGVGAKVQIHDKCGDIYDKYVKSED